MTKSEAYKAYFNEQYLMGPNSIRLLDELVTLYPIHGDKNRKILDLGCGKGLTSLFIAKETGATVYANDLWICAETNAERFNQWEMGHQIIPSREDANQLSFDKAFFDAMISVDTYHYFAGKPGFFENQILPFIKPGGMVLIAVPGIKEAFEDQAKDVLEQWLGDEYSMFHSPKWWKELLDGSQEIEYVKTWEMSQFHIAWEEWFATHTKYAERDQAFFEEVIEKYTNFVGIAVKKRGDKG